MQKSTGELISFGFSDRSVWRFVSATRWVQTNKNLAIANRSRVSCAHNTSRASMITPWP